jgi:deoxycytidylate deaminase
MSADQNRLVVGLTGSFGSGCSTLKESLSKLGFEPFSLSKYVKAEWSRRNQRPIEQAKRKELQDIGDEMRKTSGRNEYLAELAVKEAIEKVKDGRPLLFDNIRTAGEVRYFRNTYSNFFLIAVDCSPKIRWERVREHYQTMGMNEIQFEKDDARDKRDESTRFGQAVDFCVGDADILVVNDKDFPIPDVQIEKLRDKILPYINLMKGDLSRTPTALELYMGIAYTASLQSKCIKRRVGAVIVDEKFNAILSVGYNESPHPIEPCIIKYHRCYREIYKEKHFKHLESLGEVCPSCHVPLKSLKPPFLCQCGCDLDKNLIGEKAINRCTALHAEEKAILNVGSRLIEGYTIYTTTFPCFTCAQKIAYSRLASVVYVEPYPDQDALDLLEEANISVRKFEGVKAKAYFRLFGSWQREIEASLTKA